MKEHNNSNNKKHAKPGSQPTFGYIKTKSINKQEKKLDNKSIDQQECQSPQQKTLKVPAQIKQKIQQQRQQKNTYTQKKYVEKQQYQDDRKSHPSPLDLVNPKQDNNSQNQQQEVFSLNNSHKFTSNHNNFQDISNKNLKIKILQDYSCKNIYGQSQELRKLGSNINQSRAQQFYIEALKQYNTFVQIFQQRELLFKAYNQTVDSIFQLQNNRKLMEYIQKNESREKKYKIQCQSEQMAEYGNRNMNSSKLQKSKNQFVRKHPQLLSQNGRFKCWVRSCGKIMRSYEAYLVHQKKHQTHQKQMNNLQKSNRQRPKNYARMNQKNNDSFQNQNKREGTPEKKDSAQKQVSSRIIGQGRGHRQRRPQQMDDAFIYPF